MNLKHLIFANLGTIQWLLTWSILAGMILVGYFLVPTALAKHQELLQLGFSSLRLTIPFVPLVFLTMGGSALIAIIWQFRFVKKDS